jgi:prepilin-type N-terminal cleavage/methylation domain-containing protein
MTRRLPRPARDARGYTVVEVLMAMTVMAIGSAAVITMQKTSVTGNLDARRADVANSIARTWVERLQRDSMQWTLPGPESAANNLANALIVANVSAAPGQWFLPTQEMNLNGGTETMSPGFDILGRDLAQSLLTTADFCVNVRLTWLSPAGSPQDLIRADVRVLWPIGIANSLPGFCNAATATLIDPNTDPGAKRAAGADPNQPVFHTLYTTTTLRENTSP